MGLRVWTLGLGLMVSVQCSVLRVEGFGFRVQGAWFTVQGLGCKVLGEEFEFHVGLRVES